MTGNVIKTGSYQLQYAIAAKVTSQVLKSPSDGRSEMEPVSGSFIVEMKAKTDSIVRTCMDKLRDSFLSNIFKVVASPFWGRVTVELYQLKNDIINAMFNVEESTVIEVTHSGRGPTVKVAEVLEWLQTK